MMDHEVTFGHMNDILDDKELEAAYQKWLDEEFFKHDIPEDW